MNCGVGGLAGRPGNRKAGQTADLLRGVNGRNLATEGRRQGRDKEASRGPSGEWEAEREGPGLWREVRSPCRGGHKPPEDVE